MKSAMRAKEAERLSTIRMLMAAMKREVDERVVLDDTAIVGIVDKLIKQRKGLDRRLPAGRTHRPGGQGDRRGRRARRLPAAAPERATRWPRAARARGRARRGRAGDMGQVMAAAKSRFAGQAEMASGVGSGERPSRPRNERSITP